MSQLHIKKETIQIDIKTHSYKQSVVNLKGRICISEVYQQGGMSYIP